jgi:hypothetical protein
MWALCTLALTTSAGLAADAVTRLSEPVEVTATHETFGAPLPDGGPVYSLSELVEQADALAGQDILLNTRVARVCQKKGCFFIASEGAESVRITFSDYAFFIPTDAGGKQVTLAGRFSRQPLSAEQLAHYAEDLGEKPPASAEAPGWEYTIVATSVRVPLGP